MSDIGRMEALLLLLYPFITYTLPLPYNWWSHYVSIQVRVLLGKCYKIRIYRHSRTTKTDTTPPSRVSSIQERMNSLVPGCNIPACLQYMLLIANTQILFTSLT